MVDSEDDMLPDEREVIAERVGDLEDLSEDDYLTVKELAGELGMDPENPRLEDALDGLVATANYCDEMGLDGLAVEAGRLYQRLAIEAPDDHWDSVNDEDLREIGIDPEKNQSGDRANEFLSLAKDTQQRFEEEGVTKDDLRQAIDDSRRDEEDS